VLLGGTACHRRHIQNSWNNEKAAEPAPVPQILFLVLNASQDTARHDLQVSLKSKRLVQGTLKKDPNSSSPLRGNSLKLVFGNGNGKTLKELYVEHPLRRQVESYGETALSAHTLNLPRAELMLRVQWSQEMRQLTISEFIDGKATENTLTLELQ